MKSDTIAGVVCIPLPDQIHAEGITTISSDIVRNIPGSNAGVEIFKAFTSVSVNNELSTQYMVRKWQIIRKPSLCKRQLRYIDHF